MIAIW